MISNKIVRTPNKVTGGITPEEKRLMDEHVNLWISRALRTDPIEPDKIIPAIKSIYTAAGRKEPRVVIVPSPLVMAFAYGASAAIWHHRSSKEIIPLATYKATFEATLQATDEATFEATSKATREATRQATDEATRKATDEATDEATYKATFDATHKATFDATHKATFEATRQATFEATDDATIDVTYKATDKATDEATYKATLLATFAATDEATDEATREATRQATHRATDEATYKATFDATHKATFDATHKATFEATRQATFEATDDATSEATIDVTYKATDEATYKATLLATFAATDEATDEATREATRQATHRATDAATRNTTIERGAELACREMAGDLGIKCAQQWPRCYQGGNMWSGYDSYLTAFRDIIGLQLKEHDAYTHWEQASIHGGFRVLHSEFCIVSDFPETIKIDAENRPHCETGPSHRWRDGWSLYHWHGVKIPAEWIENKASLTAKIALTWPNIEQRRAACEILGWAVILAELKAKMIDQDDDPEIGELVEVTIPDVGKERFLRVKCGTSRIFALPVPPTMKTALEANAWTYGLEPKDYLPEIRT